MEVSAGEPRPAAGDGKRSQGASKEQQVIAMLQDKRLRGHEEAIYYLLRGLGMTVIETPGTKAQAGASGDGEQDKKKDLPLPRIDVYASKNPTLFSALRRLGLQEKGMKISVERPVQPGGTAPAAAAEQPPPVAAKLDSSFAVGWQGRALRVDEDLPVADHGSCDTAGFVKSKLARTLSRPHIVAPRLAHASEDYLEALFNRLKRHKHSQNREHICTTVGQCAAEIQIETDEAERRARVEAEEAAKFAAEEAARIATGRPTRPSIASTAPPPALPKRSVAFDSPPSPQRRPSNPNTYTEATGPPDWWRMSHVNKPSRAEQIKRCSRMSQPKKVRTDFPRLAKTVVGPFATASPPSQTAKGRAAHKDMEKRLQTVQEMGGFPWQRPIGTGTDSADQDNPRTDGEPAVDWRQMSATKAADQRSAAFLRTLEEVQSMIGGRGCCSTPGGVSNSECSAGSSPRRSHHVSSTAFFQGPSASALGQRRGAFERPSSCPVL